MKPIAAIFARGGSKGLPNKNLAYFNGKPLIATTIEFAIESSLFSKVLVSTDSPSIAKVSEEFGAEVPFLRPDYLATDESPEWDSWKHLVTYLENSYDDTPEALVSLPTTAPLRSVGDISKCLQLFSQVRPDAIITVNEARRNPYFNMVSLNSENQAKLLVQPKSSIYRRQDAPKAYDINTVCYVASLKYISTASSILEGDVRAIEIPISVDIDTKEDLDLAEYLRKAIDNEVS